MRRIVAVIMIVMGQYVTRIEPTTSTFSSSVKRDPSLHLGMRKPHGII
jgi:hypothetical protein